MVDTLLATRAYWDRGLGAVPMMTGAASVMDCADLRDAFLGLGLELPLTGSVLDVGCGTGRLHKLLANRDAYVGCDVSRHAVLYAAGQGLNAYLIDGHEDLGKMVCGFGLACCLSVFTHIPRDERLAYLKALRPITRRLVVDIIPGEEGGTVALWRADPTFFGRDIIAAGWGLTNTYERVSPDKVGHRYYLLQRSSSD